MPYFANVLRFVPRALVAILASLLVGCNVSPKEPNASVITSELDQRLAFARIANLAKHKTLPEIQLDAFDWDDFGDHYVSVDSASFNVLWPDSTWITGLDHYDKTFIHGWSDLDEDHVLLSLITQKEASSCTVILCDLRTREGRSLGTFNAAASCADGGWTFEAKGHFDGPWNFVRSSVETELLQVDSGNVETHDCDSVIDRISFGPGAQIQTERLHEVHFKRKESPGPAHHMNR